MVLDKAGYHVHPASDGEAALTLLQTTPIDLLLLDVMLPDIDGYRLCAMIREVSVESSERCGA
jgi:DNA-binding response OmpR family regulator